MVLIPAGEFIMGSDQGSDEKPVHKVYLDAYWIYKMPVTVNQYKLFCKDKKKHHAMPSAPSFNPNWRNGNHPIVNVSWDDAQAYCKWAGAQLPTEAQWEKAARGTDGRVYPWGNQWDSSKCVNSVGPGRLEGTMPVGSFPAGASPYGALDMAGNVWQWCADWYGKTYYKGENPSGPAQGTFRVHRGGSAFFDNPDTFRCAYRGYVTPNRRVDDFGFRCVVRANIR